MPWPEALGYVIGGIRGLVSGWLGPKVDPEVRARRIATCERCPIYNRRLGTCGTPGQVDAYGQSLGCWCHIPTVARFAGKKCWAMVLQYVFAPKDW